MERWSLVRGNICRNGPLGIRWTRTGQMCWKLWNGKRNELKLIIKFANQTFCYWKYINERDNAECASFFKDINLILLGKIAIATLFWYLSTNGVFLWSTVLIVSIQKAQIQSDMRRLSHDLWLLVISIHSN